MLNSNFSGEVMIFKNDKGFYSTTLSKKNQDGSYANAYVAVSFKKGVDIPNKTKINIKNGFLTFDQYQKEGKTITNLKIFVTEYEGAEQIASSKKTKGSEDIVFGTTKDDDVLPF